MTNKSIFREIKDGDDVSDIVFKIFIILSIFVVFVATIVAIYTANQTPPCTKKNWCSARRIQPGARSKNVFKKSTATGGRSFTRPMRFIFMTITAENAGLFSVKPWPVTGEYQP